MGIHKSAVVSSKAEIGPGVEIGPYSIIGDNVTIGRDTVIGAHVVIEGYTQIGDAKQNISLCIHRRPSPGYRLPGRRHPCDNRK